MRRDIIELLDRDQDYFVYLRENPYWHRELSFNPSSLKLFVEEYKVKRRKRLVDKLEDLSMMITLAKELM
ncbi:MAG: YlbE-like family protein [Bacilli bacterium]|nr:YlbE-like family protein [Bacillales bacterium]MDY2574981.1 YlbE-like family protein [Bacilli bacterium]